MKCIAIILILFLSVVTLQQNDIEINQPAAPIVEPLASNNAKSMKEKTRWPELLNKHA